MLRSLGGSSEVRVREVQLRPGGGKPPYEEGVSRVPVLAGSRASLESHQRLGKVLAGPRHRLHEDPSSLRSFSSPQKRPRGAGPPIAGLTPPKPSCGAAFTGHRCRRAALRARLGVSRCFLKTTALGHLQRGNEGRNVIYFGRGDNFRPRNAAVLADALLLMDALPFQEQNKGRTRRVAGSLPAQPRLSCCQVFLFGSISHHLLLSCFN